MASFRFYVLNNTLVVIDANKVYTVLATSGKGNCMNKPSCASEVNKGPISKGHYYLLNKELNNPVPVWDFARNMAKGDWGDWRISLHPVFGTVKYGRSGFFMHGGRFAGSAGCIDIGGGIFGNQITDKEIGRASCRERVCLDV